MIREIGLRALELHFSHSPDRVLAGRHEGQAALPRQNFSQRVNLTYAAQVWFESCRMWATKARWRDAGGPFRFTDMNVLRPLPRCHRPR